MNDHRYMNTTLADQAALDQGLRSYMLGVYNYMTSALAVTGLAAYGTKMLTDTEIGVVLYDSPLKWVVMLAPLAMVFWLSARIHAMSVAKAQGVFYAFAALMGISLSSVLIVYTGESVARAFFITAAAFASLSLYGYTTKRDLGPLGAFLMIGVVGLLLSMIVNMFVGSMGFDLLICVGGVLIFAGLTAYDTQAIKLMYMASDSHSTAQKKSIHGALRLYLDFINMFLFLIQLIGNRE
jgi:FtsH-binding integral membrane protein